MQKVRVIVTCKRKVVRGRVASILNSAEYLEVVGREGADVLKEAYKLQPDLLVYEISSTDEDEYEVLKKIKELCGWTKIIVFTGCTLKKESFKNMLEICDGFLQGSLLPGFLLKAVELACYSGFFIFLGSSRDITPELKLEVKNVLPLRFPNNN